MRVVQHESSNAVLMAPKGVSHEDCVNIPITRIIYEDPIVLEDAVTTTKATKDAVRSYWEPSLEEREAIRHGAKVVFECWGHTHPPILLGVEDGTRYGLVGAPSPSA